MLQRVDFCDKNMINFLRSITNQLLNTSQADREGGRTVGSGRVATIIE